MDSAEQLPTGRAVGDGQQLPDTLKSLRRKSLIENSKGLFTLQPVFMEFVTNQLIAKVCEEIETEKIFLFNSHALLKPQALDLVRETEIRFIIKPLNDRLVNSLRGKRHVENKLNQILTDWQTHYPQTPGYIADNVRNLLEQLNQGSRLAYE